MKIEENAIFLFFGVDCVSGSAEYYNQPNFVLPFGLLLRKEKEPFAFYACIRLFLLFLWRMKIDEGWLHATDRMTPAHNTDVVSLDVYKWNLSWDVKIGEEHGKMAEILNIFRYGNNNHNNFKSWSRCWNSFLRYRGQSTARKKKSLSLTVSVDKKAEWKMLVIWTVVTVFIKLMRWDDDQKSPVEIVRWELISNFSSFSLLPKVRILLFCQNNMGVAAKSDDFKSYFHYTSWHWYNRQSRERAVKLRKAPAPNTQLFFLRQISLKLLEMSFRLLLDCSWAGLKNRNEPRCPTIYYLYVYIGNK